MSTQLPQPAKDFPLCSSCNTTIFQGLLTSCHLLVSGMLGNNIHSCFVCSLSNFIQHFLSRRKIKFKKKNQSLCPNPELARILDPQKNTKDFLNYYFFYLFRLDNKTIPAYKTVKSKRVSPLWRCISGHRDFCRVSPCPGAVSMPCPAWGGMGLIAVRCAWLCLSSPRPGISLCVHCRAGFCLAELWERFSPLRKLL